METDNTTVGYKPNYLERGRKRVLRICVHFLPMMDINLITSRGDGNKLVFINYEGFKSGYKPNYLERGRKPIHNLMRYPR